MLKLYHYWSSVCSQKARLCLAEKRIEGVSYHVDLFTFDNYQPWYTKLNPKAVVPALDHDGRIITESNVILEYLDDEFPDPPLRPTDPYERAQMRLWLYNSEEGAHWNINVCSHPRHAARLAKKSYSREELLNFADNCSNPMIGKRLRRRLEVGVSEQETEDAFVQLEFLLDLMERKLKEDGPWLAGETYSLADVSMCSMINRLEVLARPEMISEAARPAIADWWWRIRKRPAFEIAFSFANPDTSDPVSR